MKISEARELARKWQTILGVNHWVIAVRWATPNDDCEDCFGCCRWFVEEANAEMVLNRKLADEETIAHEILHVVFEGHLPKAKRYDALYEQAINRISKLLVKHCDPPTGT
jgi:hypothetical protein